jgi:hypothetical protein
MTRKGIPIKKSSLEQLKTLKQKETQRNTSILEHLVDKYEKELLQCQTVETQQP